MMIGFSNKKLMKFPWPDSALSGNTRKDRRSVTDIRDSARETGFYLAKEAGLQFDKDDTLQLRLIIFPPDRRGRDDDNIYTAFKPFRDGIFLALEMNDKSIRRSIIEWGQMVKYGALLVELSKIKPYIIKAAPPYF